MRMGKLILPLTSCSILESWTYTFPKYHSRLDPIYRGTGDLVLENIWKIWPHLLSVIWWSRRGRYDLSLPLPSVACDRWESWPWCHESGIINAASNHQQHWGEPVLHLNWAANRADPVGMGTGGLGLGYKRRRAVALPFLLFHVVSSVNMPLIPCHLWPEGKPPWWEWELKSWSCYHQVQQSSEQALPFSLAKQ